MENPYVRRVNLSKSRFNYLASWRVWVFALLCLGLNYLLSFLIGLTSAPLYLDCIGTILCSSLCGSIPGMLVGAFTNLLNNIKDPVSVYYSALSVFIAFIAGDFSRRGFFRKWWGYAIATVLFVFIGGFIGSLLTYFLYGSAIGSGISSSLAHKFNDGGMSLFWSEALADVLIDLLDKSLEVTISALFLLLAPKKFLLLFPNGEVYATSKPIRPKRKERFFSIESRLTLLVFVAALVVGVAAAVTLTSVYTEKVKETFSTSGKDYSSLVAASVDGSKVDGWLTPTGSDSEGNSLYNANDPDYLAAREKLLTIRDSSTSGKLAYVYVYKIEDDGCHVVFDLDMGDGLSPGALGDVVEFDSAFSGYLADIKEGKDIPVVITNGTFGWLLTSYSPIKYEGKTVAYAGVDIRMDSLTGDIETFLTKTLALEASLLVLVVSIVHYFASTRLVMPLMALLEQTQSFSRIGPSAWLTSKEYLECDGRYPNDEIGLLYKEASQSEADICHDLSMIEEQASTILKMERNVVYALAEMVESRDECTGEHVKRTSLYVGMIAKEMKKEGLYPDIVNDSFISNLIVSAPLHDIGKIKISDSILNKKGKLTDEEFALMKTHVKEGGKIISMALNGITGDTYLDMALDVATYHHERWDGKGYMAGRKGEEIPLSARVMAVADVFDALVSKRSYKEPYPFDEAVSIIAGESLTHFDPKVVQAFLNIKEEIRRSLKE